MSRRKRIGVDEVLRVSRHGSGLYLRIPDWLRYAYQVEKGDRLRVRFNEVVKIEGEEVK